MKNICVFVSKFCVGAWSKHYGKQSFIPTVKVYKMVLKATTGKGVELRWKTLCEE